MIDQIAASLPLFAYRFGNELELHTGIAAALDAAGIPYQREVVASPRDRFDFLCEGGIVIEAKVRGSASPAMAQCSRYADLQTVTGVVLAVTRFWGRVIPRSALNGKPFRVVRLPAQSF